jgi:hypothetical protein
VGEVVEQAVCLSGLFFFRTQKKSFWHENSSTYFGRFSEIYVEKLFDVRIGLDSCRGRTYRCHSHEILFGFLHQLLEGDLSMAKAFGNAWKTALFSTFCAQRIGCPMKSGCDVYM